MLDEELAQRIVEQTMQRLGHNVNVMDQRGVIVGSGEADRLGTVHEAALLAITSRRTVVVDRAAAERLEGVRPGVNEPLVHRGQVVGAIGVSGDPDLLGEVSALLAMTAELILEQVRAIDDEQSRRRQREALAWALVDPVVGDADCAALGERLGVDLDVPRVAVLVEVAEPRADQGERLRQVHRSLERGDPRVLAALVDPGLLLVLVPSGPSGAAERVLALTGRAGAALVLHEGTAAVAAADEAWRPVVRSAQSAHDVRERRPVSTQRVRRHRDDETAYLLAGLEDDWRLRALAAPWRALQARDPHDVLCHTVVTLLEHGGDLLATAGALRVHRNTLRYRLDRVASLSGADPRDPEGLFRLRVGLARSEARAEVVQPHDDQQHIGRGHGAGA